MKKLLNPKQYAFLYFLHFALKGSSSWEAPQDCDFNEVFSESRRQNLTGLIYDGIIKAGFTYALSEELKEKWKSKAFEEYMYVKHLFDEQTALLNTLAEAEVKCVLLKGFSVARFYYDPYLRAQGDIDILVKKDSMDESLSALRAVGFVDETKEAEHHNNLVRNDVLVEVHSTLGGIPNGKIAEKIDDVFSQFSESITTANCEGFDIPVLSNDLQSVSLLVHIIQHMTSGGIGLRQICDWGFFASDCIANQNYDACKKVLEDLGIFKCACIISQFCNVWLDFNISAFDDYSLQEEEQMDLLNDIFAGGDFGKNDTNRYRSRFFFNKSASRFGIFSRIGQSIVSMDKLATQRHPIFRKCCILRPFAFMAIPIGYMYRIIIGKNDKSTFKESILIAKKREEIYKKLDLFK